jgi:hypothetical protein
LLGRESDEAYNKSCSLDETSNRLSKNDYHYFEILYGTL